MMYKEKLVTALDVMIRFGYQHTHVSCDNLIKRTKSFLFQNLLPPSVNPFVIETPPCAREVTDLRLMTGRREHSGLNVVRRDGDHF